MTAQSASAEMDRNGIDVAAASVPSTFTSTATVLSAQYR